MMVAVEKEEFWMSGRIACHRHNIKALLRPNYSHGSMSYYSLHNW